LILQFGESFKRKIPTARNGLAEGEKKGHLIKRVLILLLAGKAQGKESRGLEGSRGNKVFVFRVKGKKTNQGMFKNKVRENIKGKNKGKSKKKGSAKLEGLGKRIREHVHKTRKKDLENSKKKFENSQYLKVLTVVFKLANEWGKTM